MGSFTTELQPLRPLPAQEQLEAALAAIDQALGQVMVVRTTINDYGEHGVACEPIEHPPTLEDIGRMFSFVDSAKSRLEDLAESVNEIDMGGLDIARVQGSISH